MDGVIDWSEEGVEEEEPGLRRRRSQRARNGAASSMDGVYDWSEEGVEEEEPGPHSVLTRRSPRAPGVLAAAGGAGSSGAGGSAGGSVDVDPDGVEETVSWTRDRSATPGLIRQFLQATMGTCAVPRTEEIKKELLRNRRVVDVAGLERWLRKVEALAELAWFTELCSNEKKQVPPLELFECAFRALQAACSDELHRPDAEARRFWIGPVAVPEFFFCPVSNKVMDKPVVITSGKTVDHSEMEKCWNKHKHICPVTDEVLSHNIFIPDIVTKRCISRWRGANRITDLTTPTDPPAISPEEEALFKEATVLDRPPSSSKEDYEAILRLLEQCSFLHLIGHSPETITKLACVLPETCLEPYPELDDIILEIFEKAASYSPNKEVLGDDRYAIPVLIARTLLGPVPTRAKCAQILGLLADNYYNKIKIGELGGFAPLMELLLVGDIGVKKTVAVVLASLCEAQENMSRFVREGVTDAAISLLRNDRLVDEAHSIFLQAECFQLAMVEIMEKLKFFHHDELCKAMVDRLWRRFLGSKPGQRRRHANFAPAAPGASSSSSSSSEARMDNIQLIVSWLQDKSYNPRTYRYRERRANNQQARE